MSDAFDGPGPDAVFRQHLSEGRLALQFCISCSSSVFFPRVLCPACGSPDLEWRMAAGSGTVYSSTVIRRSPKSGGDYNVALVELDEGPRMMTRIEGVAPSSVRIGMRVRARIAQFAPEPIIVFEPVEETRNAGQ